MPRLPPRAPPPSRKTRAAGLSCSRQSSRLAPDRACRWINVRGTDQQTRAESLDHAEVATIRSSTYPRVTIEQSASGQSIGFACKTSRKILERSTAGFGAVGRSLNSRLQAVESGFDNRRQRPPRALRRCLLRPHP